MICARAITILLHWKGQSRSRHAWHHALSPAPVLPAQPIRTWDVRMHMRAPQPSKHVSAMTFAPSPSRTSPSITARHALHAVRTQSRPIGPLTRLAPSPSPRSPLRLACTDLHCVSPAPSHRSRHAFVRAAPPPPSAPSSLSVPPLSLSSSDHHRRRMCVTCALLRRISCLAPINAVHHGSPRPLF